MWFTNKNSFWHIREQYCLCTNRNTHKGTLRVPTRSFLTPTCLCKQPCAPTLFTSHKRRQGCCCWSDSTHLRFISYQHFIFSTDYKRRFWQPKDMWKLDVCSRECMFSQLAPYYHTRIYINKYKKKKIGTSAGGEKQRMSESTGRIRSYHTQGRER